MTTKIVNPFETSKRVTKVALFFGLHAHARSHPEGGGDGGEYGNYDVQDFTPDVLAHDFLNDS